MIDKTRVYTPKDIEKSAINNKKKILAKKFVFQEELIDNLIYTILNNQNIILYGSGGYGKSEIAQEVCKALNFTPVVINCYKNMPEEAFTGPLNMKKFTEESTYEINFKDSPFMVPGVLILEEFMDLEPDVASILKDIISAKGHRYKDKLIEHNIQAIIAIGNTPPTEVAITNPLRALYNERFPVHMNVTWEDHLPENYIELFKCKQIKISRNVELVAQLCSQVYASPRAALDAVQRVINTPIHPIKALQYIHIFNELDLNRLYNLYQNE